jgi:DNA-binding MarR family transcriptional regulator
MLAFLDSNIGDKLKSSDKGRQYYYRWEHYIDLCSTAVDNYDPQSMTRFIASRKHGPRLMQVLFENIEGLRSKNLAQLLGISSQHLAKLLKEFEDRDLVVREREKKFTLVRLDFLGRAYMSDEKAEIEPTTVSEKDDMDAEMKQRIGGLTDKNPKDWLMAA